jgi:hypothetical protein
MTNTIQLNCIDCKKIFSTNGNFKRHLKTCKGDLLPNECKYCKKILSNSSNKSKHQKICKQRPLIINNNINNSYNSITNNIDNSIDNSINTINNITINNFNNENIEYLNDITKKELILKLCKGDMLNLIILLTNEIYLNDEHPENSTIKDSETKGCLDVMIDGQFVPKHKMIIYKEMIENKEHFFFDVAKDLNFPYDVKRNIHKHIIPFTNWKNIGYNDIKDFNFSKFYKNIKEINKMNNVHINVFYNRIKNYYKNKNKKFIKN